MKKTRVCACFLAIAMTFSLACPAFAAGENVGSPAMGSELTDETVTTEIQLIEAPVITEPLYLVGEDIYLLSPEDLVGEEIYLEGEYDDLYLEDWYYGDWWDDWMSPPEPTLIVNGSWVETDLLTENGVSYTTADTLNAILGTTHLTGDKVAIRDAATQAGWDVVWNEDNNQIVLLDRETLLAQSSFPKFDQLMNDLLDAALEQPNSEEALLATETCELSFTVFNSLDGDKTYHATLESETVYQGGVYDVTLTLKAAELLDLLSDEAKAQLLAELPQLTLSDLLALFKGIQVQLLVDLNGGTLYVHAPFLATFFPEVQADTWYFFDLGGSMDDVTAMMDEFEWNTAALLYESLLTDSETSYFGAEDAYLEFGETRAMLTALVGDQTFVQKGDTLLWTLEENVYNGLLNQAIGSGSDYDFLREFEFTLFLSQDGQTGYDMVLRFDMDALGAALSESEWGSALETALMSWLLGLLDYRMEARVEGNATRVEAFFSIHWKNQLLLEMTETAALRSTKLSPRTAPEEGAVIIEP